MRRPPPHFGRLLMSPILTFCLLLTLNLLTSRHTSLSPCPPGGSGTTSPGQPRSAAIAPPQPTILTPLSGTRSLALDAISHVSSDCPWDLANDLIHLQFMFEDKNKLSQLAQPITAPERRLFNTLTTSARARIPAETMHSVVDRWFDPSGTFVRHVVNGRVYVVHHTNRYQPTIHEVEDESRSHLLIISSSFNRAENARLFMEALDELTWEGSGDLSVCITCWTDADCEAINDSAGELEVNVIPLLDVPFSKSLAVDTCINAVKQENTVLLQSDIDAPPTPEFLLHAFAYVIPGLSFFAPVIAMPNRRANDGNFIAMGGTGLIALHLSDYRRAGSYPEKWLAVSYGWEDTDLWLRLFRAPLSCVRFLVKSVKHNPHEKNAFWDYHGKDWTIC